MKTNYQTIKNQGYLLSFILYFLFLPDAKSQALTISTSQLNFGTAFENSPDSLQLTITNLLNRPVNITGIRFYDTYSSPAFSTSNPVFSIPSLSSSSIWIRFSPVHNIFHNSEMLIENDGLRGALSVDLIGQGRYSNSYYDLTENQSEEDLKMNIQTLTGTGYVSLGYNIARDQMFMTIDNQAVNGQGAAQNTLEGVYTGILAVGYTDRTDCQTNYGFNTEHTFPQSLFSSLEPMKSDLHHLFPTDDASNTQRGNNPFAVVTNPSWSNGGSSSDGFTFEPRDLQKGPVARAMFYFVLRYQNYNGFLTSQESVLRAWHRNFPPTSTERIRNGDINLTQHNRNPFVDYPQLLDRITSVSAFSAAPTISDVDLSEDTMVYGFVPTGSPTTYHFVIVNDGNTNVVFTNFSLTHPGILSFTSGGADTLIAPGESLGLDIALNPLSSDSIHGFLTFSTNVPSHTQITIPIFANDSLMTEIQELALTPFSVFPNPAMNSMDLNYNLLMSHPQIKIYNDLGKLMLEFQGEKRITVTDLSSGIYFITVSEGNSFYSQKFIRE